MHRLLITAFCLVFPVIILAQASGGQIVRPNKKVHSIQQRVVEKRHTNNSKEEKKRFVYIDCGVPKATIMVDNHPYNGAIPLTYGEHHVRIIAEGYDLLEDKILVNDDINPCYTFQLRALIQPISMDKLLTYNVVVSMFSIIDNARINCQKLRDAGYNAQIYRNSKGMYRVIAGSFKNEFDALNCRTLLHANGYSDAWIICIDNEREYRY